MSDELRSAKERGWRELAPIDEALARGDIDQEEWHRRVLAVVEPAYLAASTPQGGSGHGGDGEAWEHARRVVLDAVDRDGTFLDVGCANGLLMESVERWGAEDGRRLTAYGVDISAALVDVARRRLPEAADRMWVANAHGWTPPRRFTFVRTGADYVPAGRLGDYLHHLLRTCVEPGGRLVVGTYNEEHDADVLADRVAAAGLEVAGRAERPHRHPALRYKVLWFDAG